MKLKKRKDNGFYYIYFNRKHKKTLRTRDKNEATKLFNIEKNLIYQGQVISLEKISRLKLSEFLPLYIHGNDKLQNRELSVSSGTIDNDELAVRKFIATCGDKPIRQVDREDIDKFKSKCLSLGLTKTYINILLRCLRAAFNSALDAGYISESPFNKKKRQLPVTFKLDDSLPRYYSNKEIRLLLSAIDDPDFLFLVEIGLYHGLRRSELLRLQAQDVDFENWIVKVRNTKSKKDRAVPIPEEYQETFRQKLEIDIGLLFPQWTSPDTISRLFAKYIHKAGISGRLHDLRHTYGTYLRLNKVDLDVIRELMGHADIKTTQIYARIVDEVLTTSANKLKFNLEVVGN